MREDAPTRKRRVHYKGTHPRSFNEKYKELQADRYAEDIKKVMERGQTPAGAHRPICVSEILNILAPGPGMIGLDATLGFGGHAQELLQRISPKGILFGIDVDPIELPRTEARLRALGFSEDALIIRRMNFAGLPKLCAETQGGFDFALADLGVSSMQIDNPVRGFTFKAEGPLDLRFNPNRGQPASVLLQSLEEEALAEMLTENADEPYAKEIAHALRENRQNLGTTTELAEIVRQALRRRRGHVSAEEVKKSLQRTFQALRIAVNDEFGVLEQFLQFLPECLKPGGRAAILTFHSGEDRRVKQSFLNGYRAGMYEQIARDPIRPSSQERHSNPRASGAKLRWAVKPKSALKKEIFRGGERL